MNDFIFLYGPPGSGKSTIGLVLSKTLDIPFYDVDEEIERVSGLSIPEIFSQVGENGFRLKEKDVISYCISNGKGVIALGGGALLNQDVRNLVESAGEVICLHANANVLLSRIANQENKRPLLSLHESLRDNLNNLLDQRKEHYKSFKNQLDTSELKIEELVWSICRLSGIFRIHGMGNAYDVRIRQGNIKFIGRYLKERGFQGPIAIVTDDIVDSYYGNSIMESIREEGFQVDKIRFKQGESQKNLRTIKKIWDHFLRIELDRGSTALALGGGVVGDLTGFASATYLRGINWVSIPTTILAMVDASIGGKTGINLIQGKNLIGAFHPPSLVLSDPNVLATLPRKEVVSGLGEIIKHAVIGDPELFYLCQKGYHEVVLNMESVIRRAMAVKIKIIQEDPYEKNVRANLNFGHTIGHAIEKVMKYKISHGEAVAIGMSVVTQYAERESIAEEGLSTLLNSTLEACELPRKIPQQIIREELISAIKYDKKKLSGKIRFVLPIRVGEVRWGYEIDPSDIVGQI